MPRGALAIAVGLALLGAAPASADPVRAIFRPDGIASQPDDGAWKDAPATVIALQPQIISPPNGGGSIEQVIVRAMHDGERLALRLEWKDDTADRTVGVDAFRDAAAVGFPIGEPEPPPSPFMGDVNHPVSIWQWSAALEAQAEGRSDFAQRYPHTEGVWYFPQDARVHRLVRTWRGADPVESFLARGFGTLERRPTRDLHAASEHVKGHWQLVLWRPLATGDPEQATFMPGERTEMILAIWNGSHGDVNGRKSVTLMWTPLALDATVDGHAER